MRDKSQSTIHRPAERTNLDSSTSSGLILRSIEWVKSQITLDRLLIGGILLLAAFLRLYRISDYLTFLGDEGRDVLIVKRMIIDHKWTLLGPITSTGGMYLGPAYYYFMAPFLWLWRFDPTGPAVMVALFSLATVFLIYELGREFFDSKIGLLAAFFYAISPMAIAYGRSSWNPNILPFFSLFLIYALLKVVVQEKPRWLLGVGMSLGISLQLHYLALLFLPIISLSLHLAFIEQKQRLLKSLKVLFLLFVGFLLTFWPFLVFELRHQFPNTQTITRFVLKGGDDATFGLERFFSVINDSAVRLFWRLIVIENAELTKIFIVFILGWLGYFLYRIRKTDGKRFKSMLILAIWFFVGILALGLYRGAIYDYYFVYLFPLPALLSSLVFFHLAWTRWGRIIVVIVVIFLTYFNLSHLPLLKQPSSLLNQTKEISRFVFERAEGRPYNFALLTERNSDHAYRYFLELWGNPPATIENQTVDPERKTVMDQLIIICEEKVCRPLGHPLWEIAGFGRAEIEGEWQVSLVKVFKLGRYKGT